MTRAGTAGRPNPYQPFGVFAGLPVWGGGLTLMAAGPGVGKTSWAGRILLEASIQGVPAAMANYEHNEDEMKFRLRQQATAALAGPHVEVSDEEVEAHLAKAANAVLLPLEIDEDTPRSIENALLEDYGFPNKGHAVVIVDYLNCVPVVGLTGMVEPARQSGDAAAQLRAISRRHGWAIITPAALEKNSFNEGDDLSGLLGDERVPYRADRVLLIRRDGEKRECGCVRLKVSTLKDRSGPVRTWYLDFWGERFYPALESEFDLHAEKVYLAARR